MQGQHTQQVRTPRGQEQPPVTPDSVSRRRLLSPEQTFEWEDLRERLPSGPVADLEEEIKIFRLAKEVKRLASLTTARRDLHDIQTTLHFTSHWPVLHPNTRRYTQHRLRLLYLAATKGWPAAIYCDTQAAD
jgi:hypothetical protein